MLNKATADRVLEATRVGLGQIRKDLIACRNRDYRDNGHYDDKLGAAIARVDFLLYDIMAGLVSPVVGKPRGIAKTESTSIQ